MKSRWIPVIGDDVYIVGSRDPDRRLFDALIPLPRGTTYNSYLVRGSNATALVDTVNPGFEDELLDRLSTILGDGALDYIVMNHAEPDHAGAIPQLIARYPGATVVATARGASMAESGFSVPPERTRVVGDGDRLELGGSSLRFIEAPMLHWPETMFTFHEQNGILFSCDFFGCHTATGLWARDVPETLMLARSYFGEIMMPFRSAGKRALDKLSGLDVEVIAPSHGPMHGEPEAILGPYRKWTAGETEPRVAIVYVSMWGSTAKMVDQMTEILRARGLDVRVHNLAVADLGDIAGDLVDSEAIVLGSPTVMGGLHPIALHAANLVKVLRPPARYAAFLSSYGWKEGALGQTRELLSQTALETVGAVVLKGPPADDGLDEVCQLAAHLSDRLMNEA